MKNYLKVDVKERKLIMDRTFAKNAAIVGSDEYKTLQIARKDYEGFTVVQRTIKRNPKKKTYSGLDYKFMRSYIRLHESKEKAKELLCELEDMILISKCHSKAFRYPVIKAWFLDQYPEIKEFGLSVDEAEAEDEDAEESENEAAVEEDDAA